MKRTLLSFTLSAVCAMIIQAQTAATTIETKKQTLFSSVNHASTPYRIPAIATLNDGTILAIADQRPCGADVGNGEVDIYAKVGIINEDGSYTWTPSSTDPSAEGGLKIADGNSSNGYGDAAVVVDRESGNVLVICVAGNVVFSNGSSSKHNKMARITASATESGLSWNTPEDATTAFFNNLLPDAYTMFMASGKMIQSRTTKVGDYYRIYGALLVRQKKNFLQSENVNYVVYSDDFGKNWSILGEKSCISSADEAKVEELPNGDIVISSRTKGGRIFNVYNMETASWGSQQTYTFASNAQACNGELMLYSNVTSTSTGTQSTILLQSLPTGSSRSNVSVYYKIIDENTQYTPSDFKSGWTKGIEVDNGASAYSTMTILPNGEIGFLYEDNYDTSKASGDYSDIVFVPLTVAEITGGAYTYTKPEVPEEPETPTPNTYEVNAVKGKIGTMSYYIATFSAPETTLVPEGVKAYYIKASKNDRVVLTRVTPGKAIPAYQGVVLISTTETFTMTAATTSTVDITADTADNANNATVAEEATLTGNLLAPAIDGTIPSGSYVLAVKGSGSLNGQFAFCATSQAISLSPNRAFLRIISTAHASQMRISFEEEMEKEEETGIDNELNTSEETPIIYDLMGRRVTEMQPGKIYIINGKKRLIPNN
ncbi:MAG: exo-alpha-sialidase [Bacteroidaceae bacterium]|nr:exo-alpha-sialidase [Bacteroidaceae bacterium]